MGCVTPLGVGVDRFWKQLLAGESGAGPLTRFDASDYEVRIAAEVAEFDAGSFLARRDLKRTDRFVHYAVASALLAVDDACLRINDGNAERVGVYIGAGFGGMMTIEEQMTVIRERGPRWVSPLGVPTMIPDMASGYVSILTGAKGPNSSVSTACATGAHAIGDAANILRRGEADVMLAGGTAAAIAPLSFAGFINLRALTKKYNDDPKRASRPFDALRDGFVMGEGAGVVILETLEHATRRGAQILGEVAGYGMTGDAWHITSPSASGEGVARAIRAALKDAGLEAEQVDHINGHATSTQAGDAAEAAAYALAFGERVSDVWVTATKGATGHMLGAAGAVEAIATIMALKHGIVPPTINQEKPDPACDLRIARNKPAVAELHYAISNNSGFGGHNAVLVFARAGR